MIAIVFLLLGNLLSAYSEDSRNRLPKKNCDANFEMFFANPLQIREINPKASELIETYCLRITEKIPFLPGEALVVLYLYKLKSGEPSVALARYSLNAKKIQLNYFEDGLGYEVFPFYVKQASKLPEYFLLAFDYDFDGREEIFINTASRSNGKELQVFNMKKDKFAIQNFSQINNKISSGDFRYIGSNGEDEIIIEFLPKTDVVNPVFEVYLLKSDKLSVKNLKNPLRFIKSKTLF